MKTLTLSVNIDKVERIHCILETKLKNCYDSQIFIEKSLYDEIRRNGAKHHIQRHNFIDNEGYGFYNDSFCIEIARIGFREGYNGFMQVTEFEKEDLVYVFETAKLEQIIIVRAIIPTE